MIVRLYSISSSPLKHPYHIHITVAIVSYQVFLPLSGFASTEELQNPIAIHSTGHSGSVLAFVSFPSLKTVPVCM